MLSSDAGEAVAPSTGGGAAPPRGAETACGLVLAAGAGRRFGSVKQLSPFGGRPLLEHALAAMAGASLARFAVVLGAAADEVISAVDLHGAVPVVCERWAEGQAASLRAGIDALQDADAVVVTLGDQPLISAAAIDRVTLARSSESEGARATYDGRPGHPVLLERRLLNRVGGLRGDVGARDLLADARLVSVPCDGVADPTDVDTPAALTELEGRFRGAGIEANPRGGA